MAQGIPKEMYTGEKEEYSQCLHDAILRLCLAKFASLPKAGKPKPTEWTILSSVVADYKEASPELEVVALGTGTKCIGSNQMCPSGSILNDSHAEVICRRAFLLYLYQEMAELSGNQKRQSALFEFDAEMGKFRVKDNVCFRFFSTHVPCGDAAIFPKSTESGSCGDAIVRKRKHVGNTFHDVISRKTKKIKVSEQDGTETEEENAETTYDIYRTGAKCLSADSSQDAHLPGSEYHVPGVVRTKPGRGVQTLSVSCSDKIAKWCYLGIQGALLATILEQPIFLRSFTIPSETPHDRSALERAFYQRLEPNTAKTDWEKPSNLELNDSETTKANRMTLGTANGAKIKFLKNSDNEDRPCASSISWYKSSRSEGHASNIEVSVNGKKQGMTRKQRATPKAGRLRLCKLELFRHFVEIVQAFGIALGTGSDVTKMAYRDVKMFSSEYQAKWELLKQKFRVWPRKDPELLNFKIREQT